MKVAKTKIEGLLVLEPQVFSDDRGRFFEAYNRDNFAALSVTDDFIQLNQNFSNAGVIRALHFQKPPHAQSKLVRCIGGRLWDVAVDLRKSSHTYGQWFGLELSADNKKMMFIPVGFAHGFYAIEASELLYFCGQSGYNKEAEAGLKYDDPSLAIDWPISTSLIISARDKSFPLLENFITPFQ